MATQFTYTPENIFGDRGAASPPQPQDNGGWTVDDFKPKLPPPMEGPAQDSIFSSVRTVGGRILNSIGYGWQQGWGSEPLGMSPESEQDLRNLGIFNAYKDGHVDHVKGVGDALLRPNIALGQANEYYGKSLFALGDAAARTLGGVIGVGASLSDLQERAIAGDNPGIVRKVLSAPAGMTGEILHGVLNGFIPEFGMLPHGAGAAADLERNAATARSVGVVGEGEAGVYGAAPITPENVQARAAAAQEAGLEPEQVAPTPEPSTPTETVQPPAIPTIEDVARRIDPETFGQYDTLTAERDSLREQLERHQDERAATPEAESARNDIADLLGVEHDEPVEATIGREAAFRASASEAQIAKLDDAFNRLEAALTTDTPEQAGLRNRLTGVNLALRDLTPNMAQALRNAADIMPDIGEPEQAGAQAAREAERPGAEPSRALEERGAEAAPKPGEQVAPVAASPEAQAEVAPGNVLGDETIGGAPQQKIARGFEAGTRDAPQPQEAPLSEGGANASAAASEADRPKPRYTNALRPTEGTGELATRGVSKGVLEGAVKEGLASSFGDLPEYHRLNFDDQAAKAVDLIDKDFASAKAIAMGDKQPPKGILPEDMFVAVEQYALAAGDVQTLQDLATRSRLTTAATTMGQRIATYARRDRASPVDAIREVQAARVADASKRGDLTKATRETIDEARAEVRKAASSVDKWVEFMRGIECS